MDTDILQSPPYSMSDIDLDETVVKKHLKEQTSTSTVDSVSSLTQKPSKKEKIAARKRSVKEKKKEKQKIKKIQSNKISKDDFYQKHTEFRTWLFEEKKIKFEELNLGKAKEHFKKFVKKWNSDKLPKCYYRGIDVCWQDGSPATQSMWVQPHDVIATPGSISEQAIDAKYGRNSSFGTFGKKAGRKAMKELQMKADLKGSPELPKSDGGKNTPTATIARRGKMRPLSMFNNPLPPPPPLRLNSTLSASQPSFPAIYGSSSSVRIQMTEIPMPNLPQPNNTDESSQPITQLENSPNSFKTKKRPSSGSLVENDQKMSKQDSYIERLHSASKAMFSPDRASLQDSTSTHSVNDKDTPMNFNEPMRTRSRAISGDVKKQTSGITGNNNSVHQATNMDEYLKLSGK